MKASHAPALPAPRALADVARAPAPPRPPRDAAATRARILGAAQLAFTTTGYSHTGLREIAQAAQTSPTLVLRYFGSKAGLYDAALRAAMDLAGVLAWDRTTFGRSLGEALLDPRHAIRPPAMIALAAGDPETAAIAARVTEECSIAPLAQWLGPPDARARALEITMLATGLVFYLRQLPLATAIEAHHAAGWFAQAVQAIVDGTMPE